MKSLALILILAVAPLAHANEPDVLEKLGSESSSDNLTGLEAIERTFGSQVPESDWEPIASELHRLVSERRWEMLRCTHALRRLAFDFGIPAAWSRLLELLRSRDLAEVGAAASAVATLGSDAKAAIPLLRKRLIKTPRTAWAVYIAEALVLLDPDNKAARKALLRALRAPDASVRATAAVAIGRRWTYSADRSPCPSLARVVKALGVSLEDPDPSARQSVINALHWIGPWAASLRKRLVGLDGTEKVPGGVAVIGRMGPAAADLVPRLLLGLKKAKGPKAAYYLAPAKSFQKFSACEAFVREKDSDARAFALYEQVGLRGPLLQAYTRCPTRSPTGHAILLKGLEDPHPAIRSLAIKGLGSTPPRWHAEARQALLKILREDPTWFMRADAARALSALGGAKELPILLEALHDTRALRGVVRALGALGPAAKDALPALESLAKTRLEKSQVLQPELLQRYARAAIRSIRGEGLGDK
jgi:HEAT repeat protein